MVLKESGNEIWLNIGIRRGRHEAATESSWEGPQLKTVEKFWPQLKLGGGGFKITWTLTLGIFGFLSDLKSAVSLKLPR